MLWQYSSFIFDFAMLLNKLKSYHTKIHTAFEEFFQ